MISTVAPGRWTVASNPDGTRMILASFGGGRDDEVVNARLAAWLQALADQADADASGLPSLRELVVVPQQSDDGTALQFPAPDHIGEAGLSVAHTPLEVLALLRRAATMLDALHARHIVHGGFGLPSLWHMSDGSLRLPDVGLAQALRGIIEAPALAAGYAAPEVWRGRRVEPASDQYALSVVAFELFSGRPRMVEAEEGGIASIESLVLEPGTRLYPGASPALNEILQRALASSPGARFPSCTALVDALEAHVDAATSLSTRRRMPWTRWRAASRRVAALGVVATLSVGAAVLALPGGLAGRRLSVNMGFLDRGFPDLGFSLPRIGSASLPSLPSPKQGPSSVTVPGAARAQSGAGASAAPSPARVSSRPVTGARTVARSAAPKPAPARLTRGSLSSGSASSTGGRRSTTSAAPAAPAAPSTNSAVRDGVRGLVERARDGVRSTSAPSPRRTAQAASAGVLADAAAAVSSTSAPRKVPVTGTSGGTTATVIRGGDRSTSSIPTPAATPTGTIRLQVPAGSRIYVDGVRAQPIRGRLQVAPGSHDVDIVSPGGSRVRRRVTVTGGGTATVTR